TYLKQLVAMAGLRLGPPREDHIINVQPVKPPRELDLKKLDPDLTSYRTRFELAHNESDERN
ncbi:MAG: hypothetical protein KJT03_08985, partial [Verrucomicrobiae bacterium]|nr:hypothetical protein [Verrucomicrobiae bacterium]